MLSSARPVFDPGPQPPEEPYVPAHLRAKHAQDQQQLRAEGNLRSRLVRKEAPIVFKASGGSDDGKEFTITSSALDRYSDIVEPAGLNFDAFRKNPVALYCHDHKFCIGRWSELRLEGNAVKARLVLAQKGVSPRLDEIRGLVDGGFLRACSIGFLAHEQQPIANGGIRYTKTELIECSLVTIPANSSALTVD
jgi:HK97 family phage prohead protease